MDQYNIIIVLRPEETLINKFTRGGKSSKVQWAEAGKRLSGVMVLRDSGKVL